MYVHLQVWKEAFGSKQSLPYMEHELAGSANSVQFCPYEDVLGIGHEYGFSSIVVPGVLLTCYDVSIVSTKQNIECCIYVTARKGKIASNA